MPSSIQSLVDIDVRLAARGKPRVFAPGSWWLTEATRFYAHPSAKEWWGQIGRGGAKSTVIYRIAANETIFGDFDVPRGERHWATIKSKNRDEASKALGIIASDLDDLGVRYRTGDGFLELADMPRGIRIVAASVGAASGWRSYFDANDEIAKWPFDGAVQVDAAEVIASGRAMTVTHRNARRLYFSAPFAAVGPHYDRVQAGDDDRTVVSVAPSWVANPTLTEEELRQLEPDERTFQREYGAVPAAGVSSAFDAADVARAFEPLGYEASDVSRRVYCIDAAGSGDCEYAGACAAWVQKKWSEEDRYVWQINRYPPGHPWAGRVSGRCPAKDEHGNILYADDPALPPVLVVFAMWATSARSTTSERIHDYTASECRRLGARVATGDQYASYQNMGALGRRGVQFSPRNWSATSKHAGVVTLRTLMRDRRLLLLPDASPEDKKTLERQLVQYTERAGSGGLFSYSSRGGLSDRASVVLTAAIASLSTEERPSLFGIGDPTQKPRGGMRELVAADFARPGT